MKYKSVLIFVVIGGILGFVFHLIWHFRIDIELFSFAPHIITGIIHTAVGMIMGLGVWALHNN